MARKRCQNHNDHIDMKYRSPLRIERDRTKRELSKNEEGKCGIFFFIVLEMNYGGYRCQLWFERNGKIV